MTTSLSEPIDEPRLARAVQNAWQTWQTSPTRYTALCATLPSLVIDVERAVRERRGDSGAACRAADRCAADLYGLVRTVAKRVERVDLSLLAADRALRAAEAADDPLRLAAARWNLAQVLLSGGQAEGAETVALHAVRELRPEIDRDDLDALALHGSLTLVAAIAAARRGERWTAQDRVRSVEPLARRTGERNTCWTAFGPTNVKMFAVSVAVETGSAAEGLRLAEQIDHHHSRSIERRVAFLLDQAKGYEQRRERPRHAGGDRARSTRRPESPSGRAPAPQRARASRTSDSRHRSRTPGHTCRSSALIPAPGDNPSHGLGLLTGSRLTVAACPSNPDERGAKGQNMRTAGPICESV
ncbi:hypothetical protein AB0I60_35205 [Actinosynnema sp. NPDC050436]|uniref:hypothetical protein n=1 Tax=Actinosynnema sp. NPDC050436 TaxID=3155659 RepID=UPI0033F4D700